MRRDVLTGNYENCKKGNTLSISYDGGEGVDYKGDKLKVLSPTIELLYEYKNHIQQLSEEENMRRYMQAYYSETLRGLDPGEVLDSLPEHPILICRGDHPESYARHLAAFWFEIFLGIRTSEIKVNNKRETLTSMPRPTYLKEEFEKIIRENYPMGNYESIMAAYLYNKSLEVEKVYKLENN